jgi:hypothetical protein
MRLRISDSSRRFQSAAGAMPEKLLCFAAFFGGTASGTRDTSMLPDRLCKKLHMRRLGA